MSYFPTGSSCISVMKRWKSSLLKCCLGWRREELCLLESLVTDLQVSYFSLSVWVWNLICWYLKYLTFEWMEAPLLCSPLQLSMFCNRETWEPGFWFIQYLSFWWSKCSMLDILTTYLFWFYWFGFHWKCFENKVNESSFCRWYKKRN